MPWYSLAVTGLRQVQNGERQWCGPYQLSTLLQTSPYPCSCTKAWKLVPEKEGSSRHRGWTRESDRSKSELSAFCMYVKMSHWGHKMVQWVRMLAIQAWQPEFEITNPTKLSPKCVCWHARYILHHNTHIINKNITFLKCHNEPGVMVYAFNPSTQETELEDLCDFQASLEYIVSSKTTRALYWNPNKQISNKQQQKDTSRKTSFQGTSTLADHRMTASQLTVSPRTPKMEWRFFTKHLVLLFPRKCSLSSQRQDKQGTCQSILFEVLETLKILLQVAQLLKNQTVKPLQLVQSAKRENNSLQWDQLGVTEYSHKNTFTT